MPRGVLIQFRRGTAAQWSAANPVLEAGEPAFETDANQLKIGDGVSNYNDLLYVASNATPIAIPVISPVTGTFSSSQEVTITCETAGTIIRYTTDGTEPSASSPTYTTPFTVTETTTVRAKAFKSGYTPSTEATARTYTLIVETCATPVISPASQIFSSPVQVSITCSTAGSVIHYTTDATEPSATSPTYTTPFTVTETTTVRAIAVCTGYYNSAEAHSYLTRSEPIQFVQSTGTLVQGGFTAPSINVTAGNTLLVFLATPNGGPFSVSDSLGNTYEAAAPATYASGVEGQWFWAHVSTSGSNVVTGQAAGTAFSSIRVLEFSGILDVSSVDTYTSLNAVASGTVTTLPIDTVQENELIIAAWHTENTATYNLDTDYTLVTGAGYELTNAVKRPIAYRIADTALNDETISLEFTQGSSWGAWVIAMKGGGIGSAATPTISPASQFFASSLEVSITCSTLGAVIHYTTDGTTPTIESTIYTAPFSITADATVNAIAILNEAVISATATTYYMLESGANAMNFITTGSTFQPIIEVSGSPLIQWTYNDDTKSNSATPTVKDYGSNATRNNYLRVYPWSALTKINIGYDGADGGTGYNGSELTNHASQNVSSITNLSLVASSLTHFAASYDNSISTLNFDNFVNLIAIECYAANVESVSLHNTASLGRFCFEANLLTSVDFSESPLIEDIRCAVQRGAGITFNFGTVGANLWHLCIRNQSVNSVIPWSQFPLIREVYAMSIGLTSVQESNALITINNFNTNGSYVYIENGGTISQAAVTAVAALRSRGWTITCSEPAQAATPVITPTSQYFTVDFTATITCSTEGAVIHYTTDGTNPTASSPTYSAPIPISGATTNVRAIAVATGYSNSGIASATYTYGEEPEPGDIQLVQTQYVRSSDAITMNVTAGNLLLVHGHALNGTYHSVADTASNVYTACGTGTRQDPGVCTNFLWAYASTTGQITITWSHDGGWESWGVSEWSGFTAIDPVDVHTLGANGTTSGTITTTNPNDLILVCWHCESTNMSPVAGNGYTLLSDATTETEAWVYRPVEYKLVTSTVGETTTLTLNSGGTVYSSWAIALKTD